ncbi:MAG: tetratricopeptide repeat protein [Paracoccaceae bacterium]|jgi:hypothetical protein|nr:tetratricopeptide repeat protein [Paracoccaceae bacterium]
MSETDSFIDEVTEEVRRERLYRYLRRYAWIGVVAVVLIVGGAAFNEWRKARAEAEAQALGDTLLAALETEDAAARQAALAELAVNGGAGHVVALLAASERLSAEEPAAAAEALRPLAQEGGAPAIYSDLAALKLVMLGEAGGVDATTRAQLIERLSAPGAPYRLLALEQQAYGHLAEGRRDAAVQAARDLLMEQGVTPGMRQRLAQLIVALGGELPQAGAG